MEKYLLVPIMMLSPMLLAGQEASTQQKALVIAHVTVIDATGSPPQADMTVVIVGDRIKAMGKAGTIALPAQRQEIDATGKFLIPGLWDMHVHWYDRERLSLFTANGVTGVRMMWGFPIHLKWRDQIAAGSLVGPRLVIAGPVLDGPKPIWEGSVAVADPAQGRQAVRNIKREGYDFVKVYNLLPREAYFAIFDEAKKQGLPVAGHVPFLLSAAEASDAGQKSLEHLYGVLEGCSSKHAEIMDEFRKQAANPEAAKDFALRRRREEMTLDSYDATHAAALFKRFVANGTWQSPTLTVLRAFAHLDDKDFLADPRLKYMPPAVQRSWDPKNDFRLKSLTKADYVFRRQFFKKQLELVGAMRRAGVEILAGTDTLNPYCFPGFSLHDELELLVTAGLSPMEALQAATRNPARYLDRLKELGTVEPGKIADLVLLDADPLADIRNTRKIASVVAGGKLLPRTELQKMLADAEVADSKE